MYVCVCMSYSKHPLPVFDIDISPSVVPGDASVRLAVSASVGGRLRVWHAHSGLVCRDLKGNSKPLFSPMGLLVMADWLADWLTDWMTG